MLVVGAKSFGETQMLYSQAEFHQQELLPWYDYHLKGVENGVVNCLKVRFFLQGERILREATD